MTLCIVDVPSYTYAVKVEKLLRSRGYSCTIKRKTGSSSEGCGYSLSIRGSAEEAEKILTGYSIPYSRIVCGGA